MPAIKRAKGENRMSVKSQDTMNWKEHCQSMVSKKCEEVRFYIAEGIESGVALKMVIAQTTLGAAYVDQIISEFK